MKWLTAVSPYLAVGIGLFWFQNAWAALLGFHFAIVLSLLLAHPKLPVKVVFQSNDIRWVILSIVLCSSGGIFLYLFRSSFGIVSDLHVQVESLGLNSSNWIAFITYFALVNPWIEEYFWRGYLGSPTKSLYTSDFAYAGFHALILWGKAQTGWIIYSLIILVFAGWFWRQLARTEQGLLAPWRGHIAADFTILMAVSQMSM